MLKFVIFAAYIVLASAGIIPSEHHHHGLHHSHLSLPSAHGTILEHDHFVHNHLGHHDHLSHHGPIIKVASPSGHGAYHISHTPIAVPAPVPIVKVATPIVKVATPIIKYVAQPIVKVAHEPIVLKSYIPEHHLHQHHHTEPLNHLHKIHAVKLAPLPHHPNHHHAISVPVPIHSSPILLSSPSALHHATLPLASHHHGHVHHHDLLH